MAKNKTPLSQKTTTTFYAILGTFVFILSTFFVPAIRDLFRGSLFFLLPLFIFCLLGFLLIVFTLKEKVDKKLKKFLLLTGVSAFGFFVSVILHNVFYGLAIIASQLTLLKYLMEFLHATFFIISIFVCPIGFLAGAIGSIFLFLKKK